MIDHTKVSGTQTSFPVLINLSSDADLAAHAQASGNDILFTSADGVTKLNDEIESYNSGTGALIAWVQVPTLSSVSDTRIYMYFGNGSASSQQNVSGSWDANYGAVWHLGSSSSLSMSDSTSNAETATNNGATATTGQIRGAASFNGSSQYISVPAAVLPSAYNFTVSLWFKTSSSGVLFSEQTTAITSTPSYGWDPMLYVGTDGKLRGGIYPGGGITPVTSAGTVNDGNWHYAVLVVNKSSTTQTLYLDGQSVGSWSGTPEGPFTNVSIGAGYTVNYPNPPGLYFNGQIDDVRVSSSATARSAGWITTEYNNQSSPSSFYSVGGSQTSWYNTAWGYRKAIVISHTQVSGTQTNFPVLISLASDADLAAHAQSSGNDILFTSSDGVTKLNHEIESYTSGTGALIAWVQVPSVSSSSDTTIYMYFGNASASNQQNASGTYDSNYGAVWHLGTGSSLSMSDSTSNAETATNSSATATTGQIYGAASFSGSGQYISVPSAVLPSSGNFTVSLWFKTSSSGVLFSEQNTAIGSTPGSWDPMLYVGTDGKLHGGIYPGVSFTPIASTGTVNDGNWHYAVLVVDKSGTTQTLYLDGSSVGSITGTPEGPFTYVSVGAGYSLNYPSPPGLYFNGQIDEVRVSSSATARSASWITTEYNNQKTPASFSSAGSAVGSCANGSLGMAAGSSINFPVTLNGADQTPTATVVLTPDDETGSTVGWNITGTSTTFSTAGGKALSNSATTLTGVSAAAASGNCSLPTNSVSYPVTLPAAASAPTAVKLYNAATGTGAGPTNLTMTYKLAVPANAYNGSYTSTWTFGIVSGP